MSNRLLNDNVTVCRKKGENSEGKALYEFFILENVRFENRDSIYASNRGLKPYDGFKLYFRTKISKAKDRDGNELDYTSPATWENLPIEERKFFWTVAEHDLVTYGTFEADEIPDLDEIKKEREIYYVNSVIPCRSFGKVTLLEITGRGRSVDSD